jgi:short-subunit dehydrogenase
MIGHKDRYALVTGATSGIGYELVKLLAKDGKNLIIVARDKKRLEEVKTEIENEYRTRVKLLPKDLSDPKAPVEIFSELEKEDINVDVLVNNAGFVVYGLFSETDLQKELKMIQLYVSTLTHMTKLFLKKMLENKSGWILNVSSGMALLSVPVLSVYSASKAYTLHFSEALANELHGTGVSVTCLCPPQTETEIFRRAKIENTKLARSKKMGAATVAEAGYIALKKGKVIVTPGLKSQLLPIVIRILPRSVLTKMARSMV